MVQWASNRDIKLSLKLKIALRQNAARLFFFLHLIAQPYGGVLIKKKCRQNVRLPLQQLISTYYAYRRKVQCLTSAKQSPKSSLVEFFFSMLDTTYYFS